MVDGVPVEHLDVSLLSVVMAGLFGTSVLASLWIGASSLLERGLAVSATLVVVASIAAWLVARYR